MPKQPIKITLKKSAPRRLHVDLYRRRLSRQRNAIVNVTRRPGESAAPQCLMVKMRYAHITTSSAVTTGITFNMFNINSLFDPDRTGAGHQPMGRDQWANLYQSYQVMGFSAKGYFSANTNIAHFIQWGVVSDANTGPSTYSNALEQSKWKSAVRNVLQNPLRFSTRCSPWTVLGITKQQYVDDVSSYSAAIGASPAVMPGFEIVASPADHTTSTVYDCHTVLTYFVKLFNPVVLAQS